MSYLPNSVFSHTSPCLPLEGVLRGFLNDTCTVGLSSSIIIMFSESDSDALNAQDSETYASVGQDDYVTWVGAPALMCWGPQAGTYAGEGWIRYNRHKGAANYPGAKGVPPR